jgi:hypothetical protein
LQYLGIGSTLNCNAAGLTFDISGTAGLYSTAAGLLAGFAFAALMYLISQRVDVLGGGATKGKSSPQFGDTTKHVLLALVFAFVDLILVTLAYSFLAGERGCALTQGRGASEELLGGVAFAFSVLTLLYAIALMVDALNLDDLAEHVRFLVAVLGPPLAIFLVSLGARDIAWAPWVPGSYANALYRPQTGQFVEHIGSAGVWIPVGVGILCLTSWAMGMRHARRSQIGEVRPRRLFAAFKWRDSLIWYPYIGFVVVLVAIIRSTDLPENEPSAHISHMETWLWLGVTSSLLVVQSLILSFARHVEYPARRRMRGSICERGATNVTAQD